MNAPLVENFKNLYANASKISAAELAQVYAENVVFVDPVHHIKGRDKLADYMAIMYGNVISCRFNYHDQIVRQEQACIRWNMTFQHRKLAGGREIDVRGVTIIDFTDLVVRHEDFFDMGSMLYENVPLLGGCVKYLKGRIS